MNEQNELVSSRERTDNPFRMPEGYLDSLEDRLMARIAAEAPEQKKQRPVWRILKPALSLAAMFALVFGMGYGVLSLTHTLDRSAGAADLSGYATVEEELIRPVSLIDYYQTDSAAEESTELDEETVANYLASELSFAYLAEIYAQSY